MKGNYSLNEYYKKFKQNKYKLYKNDYNIINVTLFNS